MLAKTNAPLPIVRVNKVKRSLKSRQNYQQRPRNRRIMDAMTTLAPMIDGLAFDDNDGVESLLV